MAFPHPRGGGAPQVGTVRIRAAAPSATGNRSGPTRHRRSSTWATSGLFCSGQSSPDRQYPIPERVRTHPTEASGRSARHDAQPSAFSIRTASSRAPTSSATPDTTFPPHGRKNPPRPEIRRPGTSFARKIRLAREIRRPGTSFARENPPHPENPPARPSFHPAPVLSGFVPLRSPSPARFTPLSPRRNTCRASPLPPNGMPHEPRRGRPVQICKPDRMPRQKERQPAGAAALRQSDSGPIICC